MENEVQKQDIAGVSEVDIVSIILALFIPPVGVFVKKGFSWSLLLNCLLTTLGFLPGVVHALFVILNH